MRGRLCRAIELGCDTVNQAEEKEVRRQTSSYWAARKHGPEERMVEGKEKKGLNNFKKKHKQLNSNANLNSTNQK
jgi:hypothetical protein